jgi:hypothetical protein
MNAAVAEVMKRINMGRPSDACASRGAATSPLANLLSVLERHQRQMRNNAAALSSQSTAEVAAVDNSVGVERAAAV